MANNGSGFLPAAPLQENVKLPEIPPPETPVYNELITKVSNEYPGSRYPISTRNVTRHGESPDVTIYFEYVDKLKKGYPKCKIEARDTEPTDVMGIGQGWGPSKGRNYYPLFEKTEMRCFLQPFVEARKKAEAELEKKKKQKQVYNNYEKRRLAKVPMGNLLGLNKPPQPNLLSFGPTKNGLNARAKELSGLFGGRRKTRRGRKQRRRSTRRKQ
jgi:hypothetical protein